MVTLMELWPPILLSAVFVFIVSSIIHMVIPVHKKDFRKMPGEEKILAEMRGHSLQPGQYVFPCADSMKDMGSPEMVAKFKKGPVGFLIVRPSGSPGMGKNLVQWFCFSIVISIFAAYIATMHLGKGADYMAVFRVTGTVAILGYAASHVQESIWKGVSWITTAKFVIDGLVYGLVTAGAFGWLWPGA